MKQRSIALLVAIVMIMGCFPFHALAGEVPETEIAYGQDQEIILEMEEDAFDAEADAAFAADDDSVVIPWADPASDITSDADIAPAAPSADAQDLYDIGQESPAEALPAADPAETPAMAEDPAAAPAMAEDPLPAEEAAAPADALEGIESSQAKGLEADPQQPEEQNAEDAALEETSVEDAADEDDAGLFSWENAAALVQDDKTPVSGPDGETWFTFTPSESALYILETSSNTDGAINDANPYLEVKQLINDQGNSYMDTVHCDYGYPDQNNNTYILVQLTMGETYYFHITMDPAGTSFYVTLSQYNGFYAFAMNGSALFYDDHYLPYGDPYMMEVGTNSSAPDAVITYQWFELIEHPTYFEPQAIPGATSSTYECTSVDSHKYYECHVTGPDGRVHTITFTLHPENDFSVRPMGAADNDIYIEVNVIPGNIANFQVEVSGNDLSSVTYEWYQVFYRNGNWDSQLIPGETSSVYSCTFAPEPGLNRYRCMAYDGYGNGGTAEFILYIDNHFQAYIKGGTMVDDWTDLDVAYGGSADLEIEVDGNDLNYVTYQWYQPGQNGPEAITGATSAACTISSADRAGTYYCEANDGLLNIKHVSFAIHIDNHLTAYAAGTQHTYETVSVAPEDDATLSVDVTADDTTGIQYTWYLSGSGSEDTKVGTGTSYQVEKVTDNATYYCMVTDRFDNTALVNFEIYLDNELQIYPKDEKFMVPVAANGSVTLEMEVHAIKPEGLTYQWYENLTDDFQYRVDPIAGATSNTYEVKNLQNRRSLICEVKDKYGNVNQNSVTVYVDTLLTAFVKGTNTGSTEVQAAKGDQVELAVEATALPGTTISYKWLFFDGIIGGAASLSIFTDLQDSDDSYTINKLEKTGTYVCLVSDNYGNSKPITFIVRVNNFSVQIKGTNQRYIQVLAAQGSSYKMEVEATTNYPNLVTYQWYNFYGNPISGATSSTYTATSINEQNRYFYCMVSDGLGTSLNASFNFTVCDMTDLTLNRETQLSLSFLDTLGGRIDIADPSWLTAYARFTPQITATYKFAAVSSDPNITSVAELYDKNLNYLTYDGGNGQGNFNLTYMLEQGETYYFKVRSAASAIPVKITASPISINKESLNLIVGSSEKLELSGGVQNVTWTSSNPDAIKVSADGTVTAVATGNALITAEVTTDAVYRFECQVKAEFKDVVDDSRYFYNPVYWAAQAGVTKGTSPDAFSPDQVCSRGQFVTFLWRAMGKPDSTTKSNFTDVADGKYYTEAVNWAVEKGITTGTSPTTFSPDAPCFREQCVTFLWRAFGRPEVLPLSASEYGDMTPDKWYFKPIVWAAQNGITVGVSPSQFGVGQLCTRGMLVTFLYRAMRLRS